MKSIWTGYPKFKLKDEEGIPFDKIKTFPWLQVPYMVARGKFALTSWPWLDSAWAQASCEALDKHVASSLDSPEVLIALANSGLVSGKRIQQLGGKYICDRPNSHIRFQRDILVEEHKRWGYDFKMDDRAIAREEEEYATADKVSMPSEFTKSSFIKMGVDERKILKIPYGANLHRFKKVANPDPNKFTVLWVGQVILRKGFMYALEAFQKFKHPNKEFNVIGQLSAEIAELVKKQDLTGVNFLGTVPNTLLSKKYSEANAFVLPSVEEGLAMVMGEALACGCPVIASTNTGASDLFEHGKQGFIIDIRSSQAITDALQNLADDADLQRRMSEAGMERVKSISGWDRYGELFATEVNKLAGQ
ncbi:glycosyltransferase family 4 protein [Chryseolinea sp. T2]|uniref:glycosyltransferase family 4 protein n=1 Tax=Chryseolinea sp. T2 TaxID=3129255 RepID=UPI0030778E50